MPVSCENRKPCIGLCGVSAFDTTGFWLLKPGILDIDMMFIWRQPACRLETGLLGSPSRTFCHHSAGSVHDVVIVGAGMVGSCLASLLSASSLTKSLRVAIVDRQVQIGTLPLSPVPDVRVSTITPSSARALERAGAWDQLAPPKSASFSTMQVWDYAGGGYIRWNSKVAGFEHMGWVMENNVLQAALLAAVQERCEATELVWPVEVARLSLPPCSSHSSPITTAQGSGDPGPAPNSLAEVQLADGRLLKARLVVAADGGSSRIRELAGLRTLGWDYQQRGVVATVSTAEPNGTAWQRFLPTGPLALLPTRDGYSNVVWTTTPTLARTLEAMSPEDFAAAVNQALNEGPHPSAGPIASLAGPLLGHPEDFEAPPLVHAWVGSSPKSFPLALKHAGRYVRPRLALVGDAAHAVHPLAGQGVNLGFGDVEALAKALAYAVEHGMDLGDVEMLKVHYEAPRQRANSAMIAALDSLRSVFALQQEPFGALRNAGLQLLNSSGPLKNRIMQYAMGL